jgi:hypothetical protein
VTLREKLKKKLIGCLVLGARDKGEHQQQQQHQQNIDLDRKNIVKQHLSIHGFGIFKRQKPMNRGIQS